MLKKSIIRVFVIISSIAALQIAGTILLARNLSRPEMGYYRLILTMIEYGGLLAVMGMDNSIVRFFSSAGSAFSQYDWRKFIRASLAPFIIISTAFSASMALFYRLKPQISTVLFLSIFLTGAITILSSFLRAQKKFIIAIFLSRLNFLLFFLSIIGLLFFSGLSVAKTLSAYLLSLGISCAALTVYSYIKIPSGKTTLPPSILKNSWYYFGSSLALVTIIQSGNFFIAKMLSFEALGIFAVIAGIMRIFEFAQDSTYYVLAPALNTERPVPARKIFFSLLGLAAAIGLFYLAAGKPIVHWLFKGRYDQGTFLIPWFIAIGVIRTLYILPGSIIGGKSSENTLRKQCFLLIWTAIINIILIFALIQKLQLVGVVLANLISYCLLLVCSFIYTRRYWAKQPKLEPPPVAGY